MASIQEIWPPPKIWPLQLWSLFPNVIFQQLCDLHISLSLSQCDLQNKWPFFWVICPLASVLYKLTPYFEWFVLKSSVPYNFTLYFEWFCPKIKCPLQFDFLFWVICPYIKCPISSLEWPQDLKIPQNVTLLSKNTPQNVTSEVTPKCDLWSEIPQSVTSEVKHLNIHPNVTTHTPNCDPGVQYSKMCPQTYSKMWPYVLQSVTS